MNDKHTALHDSRIYGGGEVGVNDKRDEFTNWLDNHLYLNLCDGHFGVLLLLLILWITMQYFICMKYFIKSNKIDWKINGSLIPQEKRKGATNE